MPKFLPLIDGYGWVNLKYVSKVSARYDRDLRAWLVEAFDAGSGKALLLDISEGQDDAQALAYIARLEDVLNG